MHQFLRASEEELTWAREADALLSNEEIGRDLQGVRFLLKNHTQLEADLTLHTEKVEGLKDTAKQLVLSQHFDAVTIRKKSAELNRRWVWSIALYQCLTPCVLNTFVWSLPLISNNYYFNPLGSLS